MIVITSFYQNSLNNMLFTYFARTFFLLQPFTFSSLLCFNIDKFAKILLTVAIAQTNNTAKAEQNFPRLGCLIYPTRHGQCCLSVVWVLALTVPQLEEHYDASVTSLIMIVMKWLLWSFTDIVLIAIKRLWSIMGAAIQLSEGQLRRRMIKTKLNVMSLFIYV